MSRNNNLSGGLFAAKPTPLVVRETSLSAIIAEYLNNRRIYNDRLQCGQFQTPSGHWMRGCRTGTPDRFAIIKGQIIFIEVKTFGKKPTAEQRARHDELCESGAIVLVCDSIDSFVGKFEAVRAAVEAITKRGELYD